MRAVFVPLWRLTWWIRVEGREHVPDEGPAVLAANHHSLVDHFAMAALTRRFTANLVHREAFERWGLGVFLRAIGAIPVARRGGDDAALDHAERVLEAGGLVCLYPEGDWSPDGRLHRFHTGAARLAMRAQAPLVPVGLEGTRAARWGDGVRPAVPVRARVGPPLEAPPADPARAPGRAQALTAELRTRVQTLTGQALADAWAHPDA